MNISRQCAHKWWRRYRDEGVEGLRDRSSRPQSCPHQTPVRVERRIVALRQSRRLGPARLAGVGKKELDACLANKAIEDQVAQSRLTAAQKLGVASTPTFFVNGKKYEGEPTAEAFDKLLTGLAQKS